MKYILKGTPSKYLENWKEENRETQHLMTYKNAPKSKIRDDLISEQNGYCAYTMMKISSETSHIEHIKPQSLCRSEQPETKLDIDWTNMVACYPGKGRSNPDGTGEVKIPYGADFKDNQWSDLFISPTDPRCETEIIFTYDGEASHLPGAKAAEETIKILNLNEHSLVKLREKAIIGAGLSIFSDERMTKKEMERLVISFNSNSYNTDYSKALKDVAEENLKRQYWDL